MSNSSTFLNPDTYLNHLLPDVAAQFEVVRNIYIAFLGATIWDVLVYIPDDIKIIRRCSGFIVTGCFISSRIFAIAYLMLWVIMSTHPVANCNAIGISTGVLCFLTMATTSYLFLRRLHAFYTDNRLVQWVSWILWAGTSIVVVMLPVGTRAHHISGTRYCIVYEVKSYVPTVEIMPVIYNSLVFFAISYKIISNHTNLNGSGTNTTRDILISGKALPALSRAILQGGQQYYLVTFIFHIPAAALEFMSSVPPLYRASLTIPLVALTASMACRVHRNMSRAYYGDALAETTGISDLRFTANATGPFPEKSTVHPLTQNHFEETGHPKDIETPRDGSVGS